MFATLLDFDGVLVDSEPVHLAAFNDVLTPRGITLTEHDYAERYMSLDDAGVFRAALSTRSKTLREEEVRALVEAKAPYVMARFEQGLRLFPGARELIARRVDRGPIGIVSGALEREIVFALDKMKIADAITFIVSADRAAVSKPDPAPYLTALAELARLGHRGGIVAIEDSAGGVTSAKRAGIRCVAVTHSVSAADLERAGADDVVARLADLDDARLEGG